MTCCTGACMGGNCACDHTPRCCYARDEAMTTPPDTPKPPAELWVIPWTPNRNVFMGPADPDAEGATRYILAPSPQESHKLAEELERRMHAIRESDSVKAATARRKDVTCWIAENQHAILAALRSSQNDKS